jgi:hypothetical protein
MTSSRQRFSDIKKPKNIFSFSRNKKQKAVSNIKVGRKTPSKQFEFFSGQENGKAGYVLQ